MIFVECLFWLFAHEVRIVP